ncbi:MAG: sigma-70 family RNA polymerase sigma factor [Thermotogaceae bacterium]|nr:sigma-70 family RNA polymerase sigma factor [Thermotogaceae bacterium]
MEENQAIVLLKRGDLNGMQVLVEHYQVQAMKAAFLIVRDLKLAEDVVQEAFLHAAEKIDQFDDSRPFGAWFIRSVVNASIKKCKKSERFVPLNDGGDDEVAGVAEWLLDSEPNPEFLVETEETRQQVWKALEQLTVDQRAVIVMRYFLGMSEKEMIQQLESPQTTIRWRIKTARSRLRKILSPFWKQDHQEVQDEK